MNFDRLDNCFGKISPSFKRLTRPVAKTINHVDRDKIHNQIVGIFPKTRMKTVRKGSSRLNLYARNSPVTPFKITFERTMCTSMGVFLIERWRFRQKSFWVSFQYHRFLLRKRIGWTLKTNSTRTLSAFFNGIGSGNRISTGNRIIHAIRLVNGNDLCYVVTTRYSVPFGKLKVLSAKLLNVWKL